MWKGLIQRDRRQHPRCLALGSQRTLSLPGAKMPLGNPTRGEPHGERGPLALVFCLPHGLHLLPQVLLVGTKELTFLIITGSHHRKLSSNQVPKWQYSHQALAPPKTTYFPTAWVFHSWLLPRPDWMCLGFSHFPKEDAVFRSED